jgi:glycosyltransferase involved in cell wall biosynthesis
LDGAEWGIHTEPWGLVLNEAMQFGLPIIASEAVGATYDLAENGENGFIVPEKDESALCGSLRLILENQELRIQMGRASKKLIDTHFRYEDVLISFCSALRSVYAEDGSL